MKAIARKWARRNWWKFGLLTIAGWTGLFVAVIAPIHSRYSFSDRRGATGIGALDETAAWDSASLWRQTSWQSVLQPRGTMLQRSSSGGRFVPAALSSSGRPAEESEQEEAERKIVRNAQLEIVVKSPAECGEKIRLLAENLGGYTMSSELSGNQGTPGGGIVVRVPERSFENARAEIRKMAVQVVNEKIDANDVTKDYADRNARLRNLRAMEEQYLAIMKRKPTCTTLWR